MTQPFGANSTTDEVLEGIDLSGKRALVTGVSAGLGIERARALVAHGARVVGTARDLNKARRASERIGAAARVDDGFRLVELDLASLASVRSCADALVAAGDAFDVIICNAGVMACPQGKTADGFETQFGTNHLGHFLLVNRVTSLLAPNARVVVLSSAGHRFADVDLDDTGFERAQYKPFVAYGRSKTANVLFVVELDRQLRARGAGATAVHPGAVRTELGRYVDPANEQAMIERIDKQRKAGTPAFAYKTLAQGAATTVWAAVVADVDDVGGRYCEDCHVAEIDTSDPRGAVMGGVRPYALDPTRARALWAKSEELVGEHF